MDKLIQQVNLYQPIFRKKREPFSAGIMVIILAIAALGMMLVSAFSLYQLEGLQQRVDSLARKKLDLEVQLDEFKEKLQPREANQLLIARKDRLVIDLHDARRLSRMLDLEIQDDKKLYSDYFRGLAESPIDGLWLEQLQISQGGDFLGLSGQTLKPELVPQLLQLLKNKPVFEGHSFGDVQMTRGQGEGLKQPVVFHLQTVNKTGEQADAG